MAPRVWDRDPPPHGRDGRPVTTVNPAAFYVISAIVLAGAVAVVTMRDLVRAALVLMGTLAGVGVLYFAAGADFLAGAQILLYACAVPALLLFGVVLTRSTADRPGGAFVRIWPVTALVALAFASTVIGIVGAGRNEWRLNDYPQSLVDSGTTETMGRILLGRYAIPFEVSAILLGVAIVGAVVLGRRDEHEAAVEEADRQRRERAERAARRRQERDRARGRVPAVSAEGVDAEPSA